MNTLKIYNLSYNHDKSCDINSVKKQLNEIIENKEFSSDTYLLNTQEYTTNNNERNIIEKYIFDTASFHLNEYNNSNNTKYNIDNIFVEFWSLNNKHRSLDNPQLHFDKDENAYLYDNETTGYSSPFLSCVTYFNNNDDAPTLITNITRKYNSINTIQYNESEKNELTMVFPRDMIQVTFNGGEYLHGMYLLKKDCAKRNLLAINLFAKKPTYVSYFPYYSFIKKIYDRKQLKYIIDINRNISYDRSLFDYNLKNKEELTYNIEVVIQSNFRKKFDTWFYSLIHSNERVDFSFIMKHIDNMKNNDKFIHHFNFIFEDSDNNKNNIPIEQSLSIDLNKPKYNNRFIYRQFLTHDICDWIIYEAEDFTDGWMTTRHSHYPTIDIPITNIQKVWSFFLNIKLEQIKDYISSSYNINLNNGLEISDSFIVKYDADEDSRKQTQRGLEMHRDNCDFTCSILLNNPLEFVGGGVIYKIDGLIHYSNKGDMILHSRNSEHSGIEITKGKRYVLIFFLNIK